LEVIVDKSKFVILGGGMVAGYTAKKLVALGLKPKELAIFSADTSIPYERPPLSKGFLAGKDTEESIRINSRDFYRDHGIEIMLNVRVSGIDPVQKRLLLESGGNCEFEKLIVATGAVPRKLQIPGAELSGIFYLRSLGDSKSIKEYAAGAKQAAVIGGGFIGMEVAAVLAQRGLGVTMILAEDRIAKRIFSPQMSEFFESYYTARGVRIVKNASVIELRGGKAVTAAVLKTGEVIACDMVVAGIGVQPAVDVVAASGIEVENGILVNEYLETSRADIYAAGDIANYQDVLFEKRRRVEHWDNAVSQAEYCAQALLGERTPFKHVPYFFSDVFDLSYEYWGDSAQADEIVHRGDLSSSSFSVWWLKQRRVVAAFVQNRPDEERTLAPQWIEAKRSASAAKLGDAANSISTALHS
jgi:3-phenylpropionate/trans-cinnamate dioxygenase ferredoxin reductase component